MPATSRPPSRTRPRILPAAAARSSAVRRWGTALSLASTAANMPGTACAAAALSIHHRATRRGRSRRTLRAWPRWPRAAGSRVGQRRPGGPGYTSAPRAARSGTGPVGIPGEAGTHGPARGAPPAPAGAERRSPAARSWRSSCASGPPRRGRPVPDRQGTWLEHLIVGAAGPGHLAGHARIPIPVCRRGLVPAPCCPHACHPVSTHATPPCPSSSGPRRRAGRVPVPEFRDPGCPLSRYQRSMCSVTTVRDARWAARR